ncbi:MAG TPA: DUF2510 domain-containing protein, partial [Streptomyces sp.]|uniref:DUF2510 domain-containing protein n=1 Tax=Streptomyces sp. TaxID=1931 RepID=UPI002D3147EC
MSAPPSASANGTPGPGYYPDPSIPGYIRYWNGAAWVPGTSRPEPREGEPMPVAPPGVPAPPQPSAPSGPPTPSGQDAPGEAAREETGPVFLDEEGPSAARGPAPSPSPAPSPASSGGDSLPELRVRGEVEIRPGDRVTTWDDPSRLHGNRPEPASAWQADASRQAGFDGEQSGRVSWGTGDAASPALGAGRSPQALEPGSDPRGGWGRTDASPAGGAPQPAGGEGVPPRTEGTVRMRPVRPEGAGAADAGGRPARREDTVGLRRAEAARPVPPAPGAPAPGTPAPAAPAPAAPVSAPAAPEQPSWPRQVRELAQRAPA